MLDKLYNKDEKFVGIELPSNQTSDKDVNYTKHYVIAWTGYAVAVKIEKDEIDFENSEYKLI